MGRRGEGRGVFYVVFLFKIYTCLCKGPRFQVHFNVTHMNCRELRKIDNDVNLMNISSLNGILNALKKISVCFLNLSLLLKMEKLRFELTTLNFAILNVENACYEC